MITLKPKVEFKVPVEAECISPDIFSGKSAAELQDLQMLWGNKSKNLGEIFKIQETSWDADQVVIDGDVVQVKHIGARMSSGKLVIEGNVGMHLGRGMEGGEIIVNGNAMDWLGAEMRGGSITVKGSTGNLVGSAYRGSKSGMKGGTIVVDGDAKSEVGELMKGGTIAVTGSVGPFAGALMTGGLIAGLGRLGERAGAGMTKGNILTLNPPKLLPTFKFTRTYNPEFLKPKLEMLVARGLPIGREQIEGLYDRYEGDLASDGKGKILVWKGGPPKKET